MPRAREVHGKAVPGFTSPKEQMIKQVCTVCDRYFIRSMRRYPDGVVLCDGCAIKAGREVKDGKRIDREKPVPDPRPTTITAAQVGRLERLAKGQGKLSRSDGLSHSMQETAAFAIRKSKPNLCAYTGCETSVKARFVACREHHKLLPEATKAALRTIDPGDPRRRDVWREAVRYLEIRASIKARQG